MRWPWRRAVRESVQIAKARARLEALEKRAEAPAKYLRARGERNHFTEVWREILDGRP